MKRAASDSLGRTARVAFAVPFAALVACNAILGAGDYHVGHGTDGGDVSGNPGAGGASGVDDAGSGSGTGGKSSSSGGTTGAGGKATGGVAGKSSGTGGRSAGSGGAAPLGGSTGAGGATGSGGKSGSGALMPADFVGEWDSASETVVTNCEGLAPMTDTTSDTIDWALGKGSTVETTFLTACTLVATVSGRTASISPPIACSDSGVDYTISGSFSIAADDTGSIDEQVTFTASGVKCTSRATGTFTRYVP